MTTAEPTCAEPCCRAEESPQRHDHAFMEWLAANGIDWRHVVAWPQIEITGQTLRIEGFQRDANGQVETVHGPERVLIRMVEYPLVQAPDPGWWEAYQHTRPQALEQRKRDEIQRWLMHHPPAVMVGRGQTLMFVTQDHMSIEDMQTAREHLQPYLPGVEVVLVSGIAGVLVGPKIQVVA